MGCKGIETPGVFHIPEAAPVLIGVEGQAGPPQAHDFAIGQRHRGPSRPSAEAASYGRLTNEEP